MDITGNGLRNGSHMYFYTFSHNAENLLYYPIAAGEFFCTSKYCVERERYDSILALYVLDGCIAMENGDVKLEAKKDELLLIDCCKAHKYYAKIKSHTLWIHFDGGNSYEWFRALSSEKGQKIKCGQNAAEHILNAINGIRLNQSEYEISKEIYSMLCCIRQANEAGSNDKPDSRIEKAKEFIASNYYRDISISDIANEIYMSVSHFSKYFKESTGFSPYNYLLGVRLDMAKQFLQQSDYSVESIAYKTGFNSVSNFIYFFKKETGFCPNKFRKIKY